MGGGSLFGVSWDWALGGIWAVRGCQDSGAEGFTPSSSPPAPALLSASFPVPECLPSGDQAPGTAVAARWVCCGHTNVLFPLLFHFDMDWRDRWLCFRVGRGVWHTLCWLGDTKRCWWGVFSEAPQNIVETREQIQCSWLKFNIKTKRSFDKVRINCHLKSVRSFY